MRIVVVEPPSPVVSIEEAKAHLRIDGDDEDVLIAGLIAAATGHIDGPDGWLGRAIGPQLLELRLDGDECGRCVSLPLPPVIELVSITYTDASGATVNADLAAFALYDNDLCPAGASFPWPSGVSRREAVRVRYRAGYPTLPPAIRVAILLMVGDLYVNRQGGSDAGTAAAAALLHPYRVYVA